MLAGLRHAAPPCATPPHTAPRLAGVFGKKGVLQDIMSVAFGTDGITYVGTADGHIYRFAEQTMDLAVKAHGGGKD